MVEKQEIREKVWKVLESEGVARFPFPIRGRIPNFAGAEKAAEQLSKLDVWKNAKVVKINPDSPQLPVRALALKQGKTVIMPTPRLRKGFLKLEPKAVPEGEELKHASIKGFFIHGNRIGLEALKNVEIVVVGSVAVNKKGARVGKSVGYSDREYAFLKEIKKEDVPVITTVHPLQIVDEEIPMEKNDVPVDYIITPEAIIETRTEFQKPKGIYWELVSKKDLEEISLLKELKKRKAYVPKA